MSPEPARWWSRPPLPGRARAWIALPAGLTGLMLFAAGRFGWSGLLPLACLTAAPVLVAMVSRPDLESVKVLSRMPHRARVGETVTHGLVVRNAGRGWSPPLTVTSEVAGYAPLTVSVPPLAPGGSAVLESPRPAVARALSDRHLVRVATTEPFGLIERELGIRQEQHCIVHPAPARAVPVPALGGVDDRVAGRPDRAGTQPHGVREWRAGDSYRRVHWRSTARHGRLVVVEPELPAGRRVAVLVAPPGPETDPAGFEPLLAVAAATAAAAVDRGDEVLLVTTGRIGEPTVPPDPTAALDWFSGLRPPEPHEALAAPPDPVLLLDRVQAWLGRTGVLVLAALPGSDPPGLAGDPAPELLRLAVAGAG